jgi:hypothetical protein
VSQQRHWFSVFGVATQQMKTLVQMRHGRSTWYHKGHPHRKFTLLYVSFKRIIFHSKNNQLGILRSQGPICYFCTWKTSFYTYIYSTEIIFPVLCHSMYISVTINVTLSNDTFHWNGLEVIQNFNLLVRKIHWQPLTFTTIFQLEKIL